MPGVYPSKEEAFDVVISNYLIHEVKTGAERERIVTEIVRVLKPGGYVALVDFIFTQECVETFQRSGLRNPRRVRLGALSFWFGAIMSLGATRNYMVTGRKPLRSSEPP